MPTATIKMFLAYGDPKRLRTVELSNWTGKAVSGPRSEFDKVLKREESSNPGVYFLTGVDPETEKNTIYIGEAESIKDRIRHHLSKDYWNNLAFFITKDENLTKAHIRYLEGRLIEIAKQTDRSLVMNSQSSGAKLPESDREEMEVFLEKMQQILPVIGIEAFVQTSASAEEISFKEKLSCRMKSALATGYLTPNGLVVLAGSQAVLEERKSASKSPTVMKQRHRLIEEGGLIRNGEVYEFIKDTEFSSPSAAAVVIHGGHANGLTAWVDEKGVQLKEK